MSIYLINFTDAGDCDGAGCSVLSLLSLGVTDSDPVKMVTTIPVNRNRVKDAINLLIDNINNFPRIVFPEDMMQITHISGCESDGNLEIVLTFTDIPVSLECMALVDELAKKSSMRIVPHIIDHHKTNKDPLTYISNLSPDETVWRNENIIIHSEPRVMNLWNPIIGHSQITNFDKVRLRSATLLYYGWLCNEKFLTESSSLALFAYEISQYDTFEFDTHYDDDIHCKNPDGYTILLNNIATNFTDWVYRIYNRFERRVNGRVVTDMFEFSGSDGFNKYTEKDVPFLIDKDDAMKISCLIESREKRYHTTKSKMVTISKDSIVQFNDVDNVNINALDGYTVGMSLITGDVSYNGNRLCKEIPEMDFVMFVDVVSMAVSMRAKKDTIDLSQIATAFGGGGHPKAAGFPVDLDTLYKFIYLYHVNK